MDENVHIQPEAKRVFVRKMFDGIAGTYDLLNHLLSVGIDIVWRKRTVDALGIQPGWLVLDLATGTGDLGFETAARHPGTQIIGVDLSVPMMQVGRQKALRGNGGVRFVCGDAERLPFNDQTFDAICIGFGVRNFARLDVGLEEMCRVLRREGKLAVLEFSKPRAIAMRALYLFYFKNVLPLIGRIISRDPGAYQYLYESVMLFPEGEEFVVRMENSGFRNSRTIRLSLGIANLYLAERA